MNRVIDLGHISTINRSFGEAASAKAHAALDAASTTFKSEVLARTAAEARATAAMAGIAVVTTLVATSGVVLTVAQPAVGGIETMWQAARAAWRA
jgi:hypothetical protein